MVFEYADNFDDLIRTVEFSLQEEVPHWPFPPFSDLEPIDINEEYKHPRDERPKTFITRTYEMEVGGSNDTYKVIVESWEYADYEVDIDMYFSQQEQDIESVTQVLFKF